MKISFHKQYQTRDGRPVELLTTSARGDWPVMGYIGGETQVILWTSDGVFCGASLNDGASLNAFDLVEVKPRRVLWLNVYPGDDVYVYRSREEAGRNSADDCVACVKIEFEEGEGL